MEILLNAGLVVLVMIITFTVSSCREAAGLQASFSPDELKRAMKKLKEDGKSVSRDQQVAARRRQAETTC